MADLIRRILGYRFGCSRPSQSPEATTSFVPRPGELFTTHLKLGIQDRSYSNCVLRCDAADAAAVVASYAWYAFTHPDVRGVKVLLKLHEWEFSIVSSEVAAALGIEVEARHG